MTVALFAFLDGDASHSWRRVSSAAANSTSPDGGMNTDGCCMLRRVRLRATDSKWGSRSRFF